MALYLVTDSETETQTLVEAKSQESAIGKVVNNRYWVRTVTEPAEGVKLYADGARWFDAEPSRESIETASPAPPFLIGKPIDEENISEEFDQAFRNTDDAPDTPETEDDPEEAEAAE